jgi:2'-5' RNA ligase
MLPVPEVVRAFVSIELPEETKRNLSEVERVLGGSRYSFVRWVKPENLHLTLKFLGNISGARVDDSISAMKDVAKEVSSFHLDFLQLGAFPDLKQPRIIWVGIGGEVEKLSLLQQKVESALTSRGFAVESRPFVPHLTLARLREETLYGEKKKFGARVVGAGIELDCPLEVTTVSLMKSQLTPQGAIYTCMAAVGLRK